MPHTPKDTPAPKEPAPRGRRGSEVVRPSGYAEMLGGLKAQVRQTQFRAYRMVNERLPSGVSPIVREELECEWTLCYLLGKHRRCLHGDGGNHDIPAAEQIEGVILLTEQSTRLPPRSLRNATSQQHVTQPVVIEPAQPLQSRQFQFLDYLQLAADNNRLDPEELRAVAGLDLSESNVSVRSTGVGAMG